MRLGDIIIMLLIAGGIMTIFSSMVTDTDMQDYYDNHSSYLNLSSRVESTFSDNTTYSRFLSAVSGQGEDIQNNTDTIQNELSLTSSDSIGLFSVPAAALSALKAIFNIAKLEWLNTAFTELGNMFGFDATALNFLKHIVLWMFILLFVGAILRWRT